MLDTAINYSYAVSTLQLEAGHALQVMYDASGVRLHAGKQATVLNIIISQLPADHPGSETMPLRDRLGHTPRQVSVSSLEERAWHIMHLVCSKTITAFLLCLTIWK